MFEIGQACYRLGKFEKTSGELRLEAIVPFLKRHFEQLGLQPLGVWSSRSHLRFEGPKQNWASKTDQFRPQRQKFECWAQFYFLRELSGHWFLESAPTREIHKVRFVPSSFQNSTAKLNKNKSASTLHHDLHIWTKHLNQMTIKIIKFVA